MGCSFVRSILAWEKHCSEEWEGENSLCVSSSLAVVIQIHNCRVGCSLLNNLFKAVVLSRDDCALKGTFNNFLRHFCLSQMARDGVCCWHLVGRG